MTALTRAMAGLIGWAAAFSLLYALQGLVCSPRLADLTGNLPWGGREVLILAWLFCLGALAWLSWRLWPPAHSRPLLEWLGATLALAGLASTAFTGFPVLFATTCA